MLHLHLGNSLLYPRLASSEFKNGLLYTYLITFFAAILLACALPIAQSNVDNQKACKYRYKQQCI